MTARNRKMQEPELFAFPISIGAVLSHLKQDMRDDWFPDPLLYKDLFDRPDSLETLFSTALFEGNGQYTPGKRIARDVPKSGLGLRYALETDFYDRFLLQAICSYLMPYYDPLLSNRVLGHRFNAERTKEKYIFKHRIELWNTFQGITRASLNRGKFILCTDLINYFENIQTEQIIEALKIKLSSVQADGVEKVKIRNAIATLEQLLKSWCYSERHGLPQNRDASSFLANVVLDSVDQSIEKLGHDYYRYVDDIRIACDTEAHAKRALLDLIGELRKVGLNINTSKTKILSLSTESSTISQFFPAYDDRTIAIDNMWRSKSKRIIGKSVQLLHEMIIEIIKSRDTQSRQFRFCINRLSTLVSANLFDCQSIINEEVQDALFELITQETASTDQACKILEHASPSAPIFCRIEEFLLSKDLSLHCWQNYLLWLLLAFKKHRSPRLQTLAVSRSEEYFQAADFPAQLIYLASTGHEGHVERLIERYSESWPYQSSRLFLISLLHTDKSLLKKLSIKLDMKLRGTIKRIKENKALNNEVFYREPHTSIGDLYDRISPYD